MLLLWLCFVFVYPKEGIFVRYNNEIDNCVRLLTEVIDLWSFRLKTAFPHYVLPFRGSLYIVASIPSGVCRSSPSPFFVATFLIYTHEAAAAVLVQKYTITREEEKLDRCGHRPRQSNRWCVR